MADLSNIITPTNVLTASSTATLTNKTWNSNTIGAAYGGTGQTSYTNGQLLIGNTTGNTLTKATLTAGSGVSITNGAGSITIASSAGVDNIVTASSNTTLTSTKTLLVATPTGYGMKVTLPDATTMTPSAVVHAIDNRSEYHIRVHNASDTLIGFVPAQTYSPIGLSSAATSAGQWDIVNGQRAGISARADTTLITTMAATNEMPFSIDMDGDIEIIYGYRSSDNYLTAIAHRASTGEFGTAVVVRSAAISDRSLAIKNSATQALFVSCTATTAMEAVIVSVNTSTLALTVNTAATATLGGNIVNFGKVGLVSIPSVANSYVVSYQRDTSVNGIRAISVSGTTVTIGSETTLDGTSTSQPVFILATGDKVIAASTDGTNVYTKPYTVSGSTLTAGTGTSTASNQLNKFFVLGSRFCLLFNNAGTTAYGGIVTLSGTTTTISTATCFSSSSFSDAIVISSSKVLVTANATTSNLNILTDSSGTASAGTAVTGGSSASNFTLFVNGNNVVFQNGTGSNSFSVWMVDVSGSSPGTPKRIFSGTTTSSAIGITTSYANLVRVPTAFYSTNFAQTNGSYYAATFFRFRITDASVTALNVGDGLPALSQFLGKNDLQRWSVNNVNYLYKVECAA